jgi:hypothetical protein
MRTTMFLLACASALASTPAFAQEASADQFMHPSTPSAMTREEFIAKEAAENRAMAAKGFVWNQYYTRWDYVGAALRPVPKPSMTRAEFVAKEASEKRAMAAKGFVWNQYYMRWDQIGAAAATAALSPESKRAMTRQDCILAKATTAKGDPATKDCG